jgi:predicted DNA-binding transcriptional regulator YafY
MTTTENRCRLVRRLAALMRYCEGRRYAINLRGVARGLGVCERTIRRDLEALEQAGWPVPRWRDEQEVA